MSEKVPDRARMIEWLLEGDPAIRWQTLRDLVGAKEKVWRSEQKRVGTEGWGARLLKHQDADGRWTPRLYGKKWISTTYTMVLLREMGLPRSDPRALKSCHLFLEEGLGTRRNSETCIQSMVTALLFWFDVEDRLREPVLAHLLGKQLKDGGWNCDRQSSHGSFHTTVMALEALRECVLRGVAAIDEIEAAEARGGEFFLQHRMFRSHRTSESRQPAVPPVLLPDPLALRHPARSRLLQVRGRPERRRLHEAIDVVVDKRDRDGRWPLQQRWRGETWFEMEVVGEPSRWNTLRAMRVLEGWGGEK